MGRKQNYQATTNQTPVSTGVPAESEVAATEDAVDAIPPEPASVDAGADNTVEQAEPQRESKNARKRRFRAENQLPRDNPFAGKNEPTSKETPKPFPFDKYRSTAKNHAVLFSGLLDKYFAMRGAQFVERREGAVIVRQMTAADFGEITYYSDKRHGAIKGSIGEALAFHCVVAGEGSIAWLDGFIERHRSLVSTIALAAGAVYIESVLRTNAVLAAEIDRRVREAAAANPDIEVSPA